MSARIGFGIATFPFSGPRSFWRWVEMLEDGGVDSLWQTDRLISSEPILEPMATMAALAGGTDRLKFGMNVVVLPFRDPLVIAKQCATIDVLSNGRLLPAFGVGRDVAPEWRASGKDPARRGAKADEALEILTRLWGEEHVTFQGEHYQFEDATISPRPIQQPLPIWIGGSSKAAIRRTARLGSGWLSGVQSPKQVAPVVAAIREASAEAGRPIDDDHYGAGFAYRFGDWDDPIVQRTAAGLSRVADAGDPRDYIAVGDAAAILRRIDQYKAAGISKFVLRPLTENEDEVFDQTQRLIETVLPVVHG